MSGKHSAFSTLVEGLKREFGEDITNKILACIVQQVGGERVYVPVKTEAETAVETVRETPETLQKKYNVSRRTAYRWLNKHRI